MKVAIKQTMTQLIPNFNVDAWCSCLDVIIDRISVGLPA